MTLTSVAAVLYSGLTAVVVAFQAALAAGAPWGILAMGGKYPGKFPPVLRFGAVIQGGLLICMAMIVLSDAGLAMAEWQAFSAKAIWGVLGVSGLSMVANLATPSRWERILWGPVTVIMFFSCLWVALH